MKTYYVDKPDKHLQQIIEKCFPSYKGKKFKLSTMIPDRLNSYWDGGSKESYVFYHLDSGKAVSVHSNHPIYESGNPRSLENGLPERVLIVSHSYFCGKDMGITIYANQSDLAPMLPENNNDLSINHKIVLAATAGLKASYGGILNFRFSEASKDTGIDIDSWNKAKQELIEKKLLNKAGAITVSGRNAIGATRLFDLRANA